MVNIKIRAYPCDTEYYVMMLFNKNITKEQNKNLMDIVNESNPRCRGNPKWGMPYYPPAKEGDYAVVFNEQHEATAFHNKVLGKDYIKELRIGKIEYEFRDE